jgi:molybdopterin-guanine dinucleotide biosynthesis protein A
LVVLSGGESRRFGRKDKGLHEVCGIPLAKRVVNSLASVVDSVVIQVTPGRAGDYQRIIGPTVIVKEDSIPFKGPLFGLSEALRMTDSEIILLSPCDMPDIPAKLYALLISKLPNHDAAVPQIGEYPEPITAVYRRESLRKAVEEELKAERFRLSGVLNHMDVVYVPEGELEESGIPVSSLRGMNTPSQS